MWTAISLDINNTKNHKKAVLKMIKDFSVTYTLEVIQSGKVN